MDLKRPLLAVVVILLAGCLGGGRPAVEPGETSRGQAGVLAADARWSGEVLLAGDLLVPEGRTLEIAPGTTVWVRPTPGTKIDPQFLSPETELLVRGTLRVAGTPQAPVRFLVEGEGSWAGIVLLGATRSSVVGARIHAADTAVLCIGSSPRVADNQIRNCRYGIVVQGGGAPRILDNRIEDGEGGVFCWDGSRPYLKGNRVAGHSEEGIFVAAGSRPWLDRNRVTGNDIGLALGEVGLPRDIAGIAGNRRDLVILGEAGP